MLFRPFDTAMTISLINSVCPHKWPANYLFQRPLRVVDPLEVVLHEKGVVVAVLRRERQQEEEEDAVGGDLPEHARHLPLVGLARAQ